MKYLVYSGSGIGDFIIILPFVKAIKLYDKESFVKVICVSNRNRFKINKELFCLQHYIDEIDYYTIEEKKHSILFLIKLLALRFDYGFVVQYTDNLSTSVIPSRIINLVSKSSIGKRIISRPSIKFDYFIEKQEGCRQSEYFNKILEILGIPLANKAEALLDKNILRSYSKSIEFNRNKKSISLVLGTAKVSMKINNKSYTNNPKSWQIKHWLELALRLSERGYNVFLLGGKEEADVLAKERNSQPISNIYNYTGKLSIIESISLLELSDLVVGCDTGLMHCAGALNKPSLTLFGCTDYHDYLPYGTQSEYVTANISCSPCFGTEQSVICTHKKCMELISVEIVSKRIEEILSHIV